MLNILMYYTLSHFLSNQQTDDQGGFTFMHTGFPQLAMYLQAGWELSDPDQMALSEAI